MAGDGDYEYIFKILLIGDSGVGKSSIVYRFTDNTYSDNFIATIGVDFKIKTMTLPCGATVKLQIWDTAGQERFQAITSAYYRNAVGLIIVYDITSHDSFQNVERWLQQVKRYARKDPVIALVGNKNDLETKRTVTKSQARQLATKLGITDFTECSAKNGGLIDDTFQLLATRIKISLNDQMENSKKGVVIGDGIDQSPKEGGCRCM